MATHFSARKVTLVGARIRELRKRRHLTQTELSEKIGVAQSDLSRMEQGEYKVGLDTIFKLLQIFDLKIGEFFGESETTGPEDRALVTEYRELSEEARQEVREFVQFKRMQQQVRDETLSETPVDQEESE